MAKKKKTNNITGTVMEQPLLEWLDGLREDASLRVIKTPMEDGVHIGLYSFMDNHLFVIGVIPKGDNNDKEEDN